jgi:trimeric autotransporter adhesin
MATLTGNSINTSYQGLIKTTDNAALPLNGRVQLTDGEGNTSVLELGQQEAVITNATLYSGGAAIGSDPINDQFVYLGTQDFTQAIVVGLPDAGIQSVVAGTNVTVDNTDPLNTIVNATGGGGAAGLVAGTGTDSMKSADELTTLPADASGPTSIALGNGAKAEINGISEPATDAIAIGNGAIARKRTIAIGSNAKANGFADANAIAIGNDTIATNGAGVAIGYNASATGQAGIAIGGQTTLASGTSSIAIGRIATAANENTIALGNGANTDSDSNIAIGKAATATGGGGFERGNIAIGAGSTSNNERGVALGYGSTSAGSNAVALGADTNSTGSRAIAIGQSAQCSGFNAITVGAYCNSSADFAITLGGYSASASQQDAIAIGRETTANAAGAMALGHNVTASIIDTLSIKALEVQTVGGGVIMYSPNGTGYKLTVSDAGAPVFTAI